MKNLFKRKKEKFPTTPVARSAAEINKAYADTVAAVGREQYLVYAHELEVGRLNGVLLELNQEFAKRQELDKQAAQTVNETKQETKETPNELA